MRPSALELPELDFLELTVLVDEKTGEGFRGDPGVSYLVRTTEALCCSTWGLAQTPRH